MPKKFSKKYIVEDTTGGTLRFYFRKRGQKKVRLPGVPGSDEFNEAYYKALSGIREEEPQGPKMAKEGTFRWLCQLYFQSGDYKLLDPHTQLVRKQIVEHMWAEPIKPDSKVLFEDVPIPAFNAMAVRTLRDRKVDLPEAANSRVKVLRAIFRWATSPGVEKANTNPARDIPYFKTGSDGFHTWTENEVAQFESTHPIGTKPRLAMALMLYTSQRRSDAIVLGRQHVVGDSFKFTQFKGRNKKPVTLELPIHPELKKVLDASPCGELTYLVTEFKKPFTSAGFGNWFRKQCDKAGLLHCSAHGLRKVAATRMANNGATEKQIMSVTGHTTSKEVNRYTKAASQRRLAKGAVQLLDKPE